MRHPCALEASDQNKAFGLFRDALIISLIFFREGIVSSNVHPRNLQRPHAFAWPKYISGGDNLRIQMAGYFDYDST